MTTSAQWVQRAAKRMALAAGLGYLIGTFPTADLVARRASHGNVDLRRSGSGNPGAANAADVLGKKVGAIVMVGDVAKGVLASAAGAAVAGPAGAHLGGTACVAGHCYPVWNGFDGGKGVAASVGQCLATFPAYFPIDVAVAAATAANPKFEHRAFLATLMSSVCWVTGGVLWWVKGWRNLWGPKPTVLLPLAAAVSCSLITQRFLAAEAKRDANPPGDAPANLPGDVPANLPGDAPANLPGDAPADPPVDPPAGVESGSTA